MSRAPLLALSLAVLPAVRLAAWQCPDGAPPPCRGGRAAPTPLVAVLLFENVTMDTTAAYLAPGLSEEVIRLLRATPGLRVASRFQTERFGTGRGREPAAIAAALGATFLVSGSVQREGSHIRVRVEMTRAPGFDLVYSDRFDRQASALLALQDELAAAIAREVQGRTTVSAAGVPARAAAIPAEAQDHYLRGNYQLEGRGLPGRGTLGAIREYARAIALAPRFGLAQARYAYAHANLLDNGTTYDSLPRDSLLARGEAALSVARREAPDASDTWMADAYLRMARYPRTFDGVTESFARAIAIDPENAEAHHQYAGALLLLGRDSLAESEFRRAIAIDPHFESALAELARLYALGRRFPEARAWYDSALARKPTDLGNVRFFKSRALAASGDTAAQRAFQDTSIALVRALGGTVPQQLLGQRALRSGDTTMARDLLSRLADRRLRGPTFNAVMATGLAADLVAVGLNERALDVLEHAAPRDLYLLLFLRYADLDPLRAEPRFRHLEAEARGATP